VATAASTLPRAGLVLGRYRPLRPLGSGGSGSVWLARDEGSGLDVALKIVPREGKAAARAEREAAAAARLRHERCLRAYALAHDEGHVYIAYEYVPGRTLREALRNGGLDDRDAVEAAAQILDGLAHAHEHGIVHRDVKPSNVLLADGAAVSVRLLAFEHTRTEEDETLTAVGDVPGTLAYIAPERLAGKGASPGSDVWATGVLLWEALAGEHPFWKPSLLESARAISAGAPPLASVRPDLPKPLLAAVDRALSLEPGRRPSARRLAAALRASLVARRPRRASPRRRPRLPRPTFLALWPRVLPAGLAALTTGSVTSALPFYPAGWPPALAALAAALTCVSERAGLVFALAVPLLPLGNLSLGLALLYAGAAVLWLALFAREPRYALLPALGILLGPLAALGLLPLAVQGLRSPLRRALAAGGAVLAAVVAAGLRGTGLPFTSAEPAPLALAATSSPLAAAHALLDALAQHPALPVETLALAVAAAVLPAARARGQWGIAGWGAGALAVTLLAAPEVAALPFVLSLWATCLLLAGLPWLPQLRPLLARSAAREPEPDPA